MGKSGRNEHNLLQKHCIIEAFYNYKNETSSFSGLLSIASAFPETCFLTWTHPGVTQVLLWPWVPFPWLVWVNQNLNPGACENGSPVNCCRHILVSQSVLQQFDSWRNEEYCARGRLRRYTDSQVQFIALNLTAILHYSHLIHFTSLLIFPCAWRQMIQLWWKPCSVKNGFPSRLLCSSYSLG